MTEMHTTDRSLNNDYSPKILNRGAETKAFSVSEGARERVRAGDSTYPNVISPL